MTTFEQLHGGRIMAKYPALFRRALLPYTQSCMSWGLACSEHWWPIIDRACETLAEIPGLEIEQVKEKFGGLRIYAHASEDTTDAQWDTINRTIDAAAQQAEHTCEKCGAPGTVRNLGGWMSAVCPWHELQYLREAVANLRQKLHDQGATAETITQIQEGDHA